MFDGHDTAVSEKTWEASLLAAGAVIEACDAVMKEGFRNAFCAVRPPGHHAGIFGKTFHCDDQESKACSNGFCFINNVAVAAAYLKSHYRNQIGKIAIVDFDVHHGNGTQEIIEALIKPKAFKVKTNVSPFSTCEVITHQYKPWLDFDDGKNVLFVSLHLHDYSEQNQSRTFYPGTGAEDENTTKENQDVYPGGIFNVPILPGQATAERWRQDFTQKIFPRLLEFSPDFIFISAGFDAHERDQIHGKNDTGVNEFDYKWVTENLQKIANQTAQGRIVSVLEGGYRTDMKHLSPLAQSVAAHVRALSSMHSGSLISDALNENQYFQLQAHQRSLLAKRLSEHSLSQYKDIQSSGMQLRAKRQKIDEPKQEYQPLEEFETQWIGEDIEIEIEQQVQE